MIKTQAKLDVFFKHSSVSDASSPSAAAEARASLSKRAFDRDLQLKAFKQEAIGLLGIKVHSGGGRPVLANERKWAVLHEAMNTFKADLEERWEHADYIAQWSQLGRCEEYIKRVDPNAISRIQTSPLRAEVIVDQSHPPEPTQSQKMNKVVKLIEKSLLHIWDKSGQHVRFSTKEEYQSRCLELFSWSPKDSTAFRHLKEEKLF